MRCVRRRATSLTISVLALLSGCISLPLLSFDAGQPIQLPADESPHGYGQAEWWYISGRLETEDANGIGLEAVVFHVPPGVTGSFSDTWIAHYSVLDQAAGAFRYDQSSEARRFEQKVASSNSGLELHTQLVQMAGEQTVERLAAVMGDGSYALDLALADAGGPVLHGGNGRVPFGDEGVSFYYSRPTVTATGTLVIDGRPMQVSGLLWFDRQWGSDLRNPWLGWDWFSLRLDDGTRVMLYRFRDAQPPVAFGTFVPPIGDPSPLSPEDFTIEPTQFWASPRSDRTYPVSWEVQILNHDMVVHVAAVADDQELDARRTTLNVYWEGLCKVTGSIGARDATGWAYVELTNYPIDWRALIRNNPR